MTCIVCSQHVLSQTRAYLLVPGHVGGGDFNVSPTAQHTSLISHQSCVDKWRSGPKDDIARLEAELEAVQSERDNLQNRCDDLQDELNEIDSDRDSWPTTLRARVAG